MEKYLTRVGQVYSAKNKLEIAVQDFLKGNDRKLINGTDLKKFKDGIIKHIEFLNFENSRCKSKNPSWFISDINFKDHAISGIDCITFNIYEISQEYEAG